MEKYCNSEKMDNNGNWDIFIISVSNAYAFDVVEKDILVTAFELLRHEYLNIYLHLLLITVTIVTKKFKYRYSPHTFCMACIDTGVIWLTSLPARFVL